MAGQGLHPAEHRNGPTGCVKLRLKKSQTRFVALAAAER